MALLRRAEGREDPYLKKARKRVKKMGSGEMLDWAEAVAGMGLARTLADYRRNGDPDCLMELSEAVHSLRALVDELLSRRLEDRK